MRKPTDAMSLASASPGTTGMVVDVGADAWGVDVAVGCLLAQVQGRRPALGRIVLRPVVA